jgi:uncharacterized protein YfkK (UPF0435 family)
MFNDNISQLHELRLKERRQRAAEMILESEVVTSGLEDDEAEVLLNWALERAEGYALSTKDMEDEEAHGQIAANVGEVRRLMKIVSDLVEDKDDLSSEEMVEELTRLISLAVEEHSQEATEVLPESEPATPILEDDETEAQFDWTVPLTEGYACSKEDREAHERVVESAGKVRPLTAIVNDLVERKDDLSPMEMVERLTYLLSSAMEDVESSYLTDEMKGEENDKVGDYRRDRARFC